MFTVCGIIQLALSDGRRAVEEFNGEPLENLLINSTKGN